MKGRLVPAVVALALLAAGAVVVWLQPWALDTDAAPTPLVERDAEGAPTLAVNPRKAAEHEAATTIAALDPRLDRAGRDLGQIRGFVIDSGDRPVADASVRIVPVTGVIAPGMEEPTPDVVTDSMNTNADGRFAFTVPLGAYRVKASKKALGAARVIVVAANDASFTQIRLAKPKSEYKLTVHVIDAHGADAADAQVTLIRVNQMTSRHATTDARGRAFFDVEAWPNLMVRAEGAQGVAQSKPQPQGDVTESRAVSMKLQLAQPGVLEGHVGMPAGVQAPVEVQAWMLTGGPFSWCAATGESTQANAQGHYRFDGLAAGEYALRVRAGSLRVDRGAPREPDWRQSFPFALTYVTVEAGRTTTEDLKLVVGGTLRGRITGPDGPVAGAKVEAHIPAGPSGHAARHHVHDLPVWRLDSRWVQHGYHPFAYRTTQTDAEGRWALSGLLPSDLYRVRIIPRGDLSFAYRHDVHVADGEVTEIDEALRPAGALEVVTAFNSYWGIREIGAEVFRAIWIAPSGSAPAARIPHLPAGSYELMTGVSGQGGRTPIQMATFTIRAGATTFLDLRTKGTHQLALRVMRAGVPVVGARVTPFRLGTRHTGADGRVMWPTVEPYKYELYVRVQAPEPGAAVVRFTFAADPSGAKVRDLELPAGRIQARFVDGAGQGVAGAQFTVSAFEPKRGRRHGPGRRRVSGPGIGTLTQARGTADGSGVVQWASLPRGSYRIEAQDPATGMRARHEVTLSDTELPEVVLRGYEPVSIRVRVVDEAGHAVAGAQVTASAWVGADLTAKDTKWDRPLIFRDGLTTGEDGIVILRGVPVGAVRVSANKSFLAKSRGYAALQTVLGTGNAVEIVMKPKKRGW